MEYQARLRDDYGVSYISITELSPEHALIYAYKLRKFIQQNGFHEFDAHLQVTDLVEIIRHDDDFVEHQPIWTRKNGFFKIKDNE